MRLGSANTSPDHLRRVDDLVETFLVDHAGGQHGLFEGQRLVIGLVGDGAGFS